MKTTSNHRHWFWVLICCTVLLSVLLYLTGLQAVGALATGTFLGFWIFVGVVLLFHVVSYVWQRSADKVENTS